MKMKIGAMLALLLVLGSAAAFADTVVTTTNSYPYFHAGTSPVGTVFYFLGDVVALPFRLLGSLFDSLF